MEPVINDIILVTGANGFTGKHLCKTFHNHGYKVYGTGRADWLGQEGVEYVKSELNNFDEIIEVLNKVKPSYIVHLAADSSSIGCALNKYSTNTLLSENLLLACSHWKHKGSLKKIILASSSAVYDISDNAIDEEQRLNPRTHYALSKYCMEQIARQFNLPILIVRPFNYTGNGHDSRFVVPKIIKHFLLKSEFIELGDQSIRREFNSIDYVVDCYRKLLIEPKAVGVVNICSGRHFSIKEIIKMCELITGNHLHSNTHKDYIRKNDDSLQYGNPEKLRTLIDLDLGQNDINNLLGKMLNKLM